MSHADAEAATPLAEGAVQPAPDQGAGEAPSLPPEPVADHVRLVEAAIFAAPAPVTRAQLAALLPEGAALDACLAALSERYAGAGIVLVEAGQGWMFRTADDLGPALSRGLPPPKRLSRAGVETLAVIAWHQPVTRSDIEGLRGTSVSGEIFETLTALDLIAPAGRKETPGRPVLWKTTEQFLVHFGLARLEDLPDWRQVRELGLGLGEEELGPEAAGPTADEPASDQPASDEPASDAAASGAAASGGPAAGGSTAAGPGA